MKSDNLNFKFNSLCATSKDTYYVEHGRASLMMERVNLGSLLLNFTLVLQTHINLGPFCQQVLDDFHLPIVSGVMQGVATVDLSIHISPLKQTISNLTITGFYAMRNTKALI